MIRGKAQDKVADSNTQGKDEKHQRPEVTLTLQFCSSETEDFDQFGKYPALQ